MKYSSSCMLLVASLGAVSGFVQPASRAFPTARFVVSEPEVEVKAAAEEEPAQPAQPAAAVEEPAAKKEESFKYKATFGASTSADADKPVDAEGALQP